MPKFSSSFDWSIAVYAVLLCGFGLAIIASVAPDLFLPQFLFVIAGLGLFFFFSALDYRIFASTGKIVFLISLTLLAITLFLGLESRGAIRWISLGPLRLQFSEILKPFLITSIASFLLQEKYQKLPGLFILLVITFLPVLLVFRQPDLGSALVYTLGFGMMIFISGTNLGYLLSLLLLFFGAAPAVWHFLATYQKQRIIGFLTPGFDPLGANYNAIQAMITVGSGMIFGRGLGRGTQSHLFFLPERHTDFIFASAAEEVGFVGAGLLLILLFLLVRKVLAVGRTAPDKFGQLVATGIGMVLLSQIFINVGMNLGVVPVTGVTLPLISYGGSSILATLISLGIVENISLSARVGQGRLV